MKVKVLQAATNKCNKTCKSAPTFLGQDNEFLDSQPSLEPTQVFLSENYVAGTAIILHALLKWYCICS